MIQMKKSLYAVLAAMLLSVTVLITIDNIIQPSSVYACTEDVSEDTTEITEQETTDETEDVSETNESENISPIYAPGIPDHDL